MLQALTKLTAIMVHSESKDNSSIAIVLGDLSYLIIMSLSSYLGVSLLLEQLRIE